MQPFQQEHCDQGCPNLDAKCVLTGADKALHGQVLFQRLEKQFDLPALFVDGGDGGGAEIKQIGEQYDLPLVIRIPNYQPAQRSGAVGLRLGAGELDDLVGADIAVLRNLELGLDGKDGIVLQAGDEEYARKGPAAEQGVVGITAIHGHDGTGVQAERIGQFDVAAFGFGEQHVGGQVVVVIEQDVRFDATLGTAEPCPRKHREAQRDSGRIQQQ